MAKAAEAHWVLPETGAIADEGKFAHLLAEAFLALSDVEPDATNVAHWRGLVRRAAGYLHGQVRDANGHYSDRWERPVTVPLSKVALIDQASAARAFLVLSRY